MILDTQELRAAYRRPTMYEAPPCVEGRAHHRVCGDILIERSIPDYFDTHPHTPTGEESQVCLVCGDVLVVVLWWKRERLGRAKETT